MNSFEDTIHKQISAKKMLKLPFHKIAKIWAVCCFVLSLILLIVPFAAKSGAANKKQLYDEVAPIRTVTVVDKSTYTSTVTEDTSYTLTLDMADPTPPATGDTTDISVDKHEYDTINIQDEIDVRVPDAALFAYNHPAPWTEADERARIYDELSPAQKKFNKNYRDGMVTEKRLQSTLWGLNPWFTIGFVLAGLACLLGGIYARWRSIRIYKNIGNTTGNEVAQQNWEKREKKKNT